MLLFKWPLQMGEKEDILEKEIETWGRFEYALREENRILFQEMLDKCRKGEYFECLNAKGENHSTESLFLILILEQQRMIINLIEKLGDKMKDKNSEHDWAPAESLK